MDTVINGIKEVIAWVMANKDALLQVWAYIIAIASILIKILPALPANSPLLPIVKFVGKFLALNKSVPDSARPVVK